MVAMYTLLSYTFQRFIFFFRIIFLVIVQALEGGWRCSWLLSCGILDWGLQLGERRGALDKLERLGRIALVMGRAPSERRLLR